MALDNVSLPVRSAQLRDFVDGFLLEREIIPHPGVPMSLCQTGEAYIEILVSSDSFDNLRKSLAGAIYAFSSRPPIKGYVSEKLYWRISPEYELKSGHHRAYARFKLTDKPELTIGPGAMAE